MKGIKGWRSSREVLKTYSKTGWASALLDFVDSIYLSANSCQMNSYKASAPSWNLYSSKDLVTFLMVWSSFSKICLSSDDWGFWGDWEDSGLNSMMNLPIFQSLLVKFLIA